MNIEYIENLIKLSEKYHYSYTIEVYGIVINILTNMQKYDNLVVYYPKQSKFTLRDYANVGLPLMIHIYDEEYKQYCLYFIENDIITCVYDRLNIPHLSQIDITTEYSDLYNQLLLLTKV